MVHLIEVVSNKTWWELALEGFGIIFITSGLILAIFNRSRKVAGVTISKTEGEIYKNILEKRLAELNITEIIEQKVESEIKPLKEMLWNRELEHFEVKKEMQERLMKELEEKKVVMRENSLLHNEVETIRKEHELQAIEIDKLKQEVEILKRQSNGK